MMNKDIEILIVEDSPTQVEHLKYLLDGEGYTVTIATNGRQALGVARARKPTIIISDIMMPEMDGYALCRTIKSDAALKDVPVILVTDLNSPQDVVMGLQCCADNFITKPYDPQFLLARITQSLRNKELRANQPLNTAVEIELADRRYTIAAERYQILDLLIPTYEEAVRLNQKLRDQQKELAEQIQERTAANEQLLIEVAERRRMEDALRIKTEQLTTVTDAMTAFLESGDFREASAQLLEGALTQTESEYGFVGVVVEGPVLRILAHKGIVWSATVNREFYESAVRSYQEVGYLEFTNFGNLFGRVITSGKPVLSNDPSKDQRSGGLPPGHPPLHRFLGVPIYKEADVVGMIGIANRPTGYTEQEQAKIEILSHTAGVLCDSYRRRERELAQEAQRKRAEEEIKKHREQLEAANKELEAFSYSVSHDLRAPLRHVNGYTDLLLKHAAPTLDEKGQRYLRTISESVMQMGVLIDDLLAFSRMGRAELRDTTVNLEQLTKQVLNELKPETGERCIVWTVGALPEVRGDRAMLRQVLINLLGNAVKYTRPCQQARIEIGRARDGEQPDEVVIFVRDNGVGFDMQYAHKLFGVFQRLHGITEFEGTGIGLALVQRVILKHGGRIWAEGAVDKGATFYFVLPAKVDRAQPTTATNESGGKEHD